MMSELAGEFQDAVGSIVNNLSGSAKEMEQAAQTLTASSEETSIQATTVASASEEASSNVQTVAAAAEQLAASVQEIGAAGCTLEHHVARGDTKKPRSLPGRLPTWPPRPKTLAISSP